MTRYEMLEILHRSWPLMPPDSEIKGKILDAVAWLEDENNAGMLCDPNGSQWERAWLLR